jgi:hypothetical protein
LPMRVRDAHAFRQDVPHLHHLYVDAHDAVI